MKKLVSAIIMATLSIITVDAQNKMYADETECEPGKSVKIAIKMTNEVEVTSWQFNMILPEGISVALDPDDEESLLVELATERTTAKKHNAFDSSINKDGELIVTCASTTNKTYATGEGEICYVTIDIAKDLDFGTYNITIKNPVLTEAGTNKSLYPGDFIFKLTVTKQSAISSPTATTQSTAYNYLGYRVSDKTKGIVIKDGRKVIVN